MNATEAMGTFTGQVWLDRVITPPGAPLTVSNVSFSPCARTNWHWHENGQLLRVMAGSGWICDKGQKPKRINTGDTIWCPAGTVHWHGADDDSFMMHQVTTLGETKWFEPVTNEEYGTKH